VKKKRGDPCILNLGIGSEGDFARTWPSDVLYTKTTATQQIQPLAERAREPRHFELRDRCPRVLWHCGEMSLVNVAI